MSITSTLIRTMFRVGDKKRDKGLSTPEDIIRIDNISYGPFSNWNLLDVYRPKDINGILPVIVNVHGGGWVYGHKETYQYYCMNLAQKGFVVVNFSYRLAPEHKYPAGIEDLNNVMKWIFDESNNEGFDLNNIFLFGDSAGANMASLYSCICTNPTYAKEYDFDIPNNFVPKGLALGCGMYELEKLTTGSKLMRGMLKDLLGKNEVQGKLKLIEPLRYMTKDFPSAFIMTSTGDFLKSQTEGFGKFLKSMNTPYLLKIYGDEDVKPPHVFHCNIRNEVAQQCNEDTCNYIKSLIS